MLRLRSTSGWFISKEQETALQTCPLPHRGYGPGSQDPSSREAGGKWTLPQQDVSV